MTFPETPNSSSDNPSFPITTSTLVPGIVNNGNNHWDRRSLMFLLGERIAGVAIDFVMYEFQGVFLEVMSNAR